MKTVLVKLKHNPYPIYIGDNILDKFHTILARHVKTKQIAIISSENIFELYGKRLLRQFDKSYQVKVLFVPQGEQAKSAEQAQQLYTSLIQEKFERNCLIIALGGGVVGDLSGFVAATYLRGVDFVQIPTTLLAQVDSSIGGKVGINHPLGKNLIGAFKQPLFVYCDVAVLQTLPDEEIRCGLGEVIKYAFILNKDLFVYLQKNLDKALRKDAQTLLHLVKISAREKARVVARDELEKNLRMILNFGHTFGHALETNLDYKGLKHGEAVILGMECALIYALDKKYISRQEFSEGRALLKRVPVGIEKNKLEPGRLLEIMKRDKKVKDEKIRLILVNEIGKYLIDQEADMDMIEASLRKFIGKL